MATPTPDPLRARRSEALPGRPLNIEGDTLVVASDELVSWGVPSQSNLRSKKNLVVFASVDDILKRFGFREYRKMRDDDTVKAALAFKKVLIYGRAWDIKPAEDTQDAKDVAEFIAWNLSRFNFKGRMREAMTALDFGFSIGEIIWERAEFKGKPCIALKDIKFRDPSLFEYHADIYGNIAQWRQRAQYGGPMGGQIDIPVEKVFHFAYNQEFGDHYGRSDLRAAYKNWWAKKFIIQFWNVFLERMGAPLTLVKYPMGATAEMKDTLKRILGGISSKTEIMVPEGVAVELIEMTKSGQGNYGEALAYHDGAIAKAILMPALFGFGKEMGRGSDSQSRLQLKTLFKMAQTLSEEFIYSFQQQVLKQLVDFNYDVQLYPQFIWADYGEYEAKDIIDSIRLLHNAGIIDPDQEDVNYARGVLGLPIRNEDHGDEVLRPAPPIMGGNTGTPPPSPGQNNEVAKKGGVDADD